MSRRFKKQKYGRTHDGLARECSGTLQVKEHGGIVTVVGGIEARDIDQTVPEAVTEFVRVDGRSPVVCEVLGDPISVRVRDILGGGCQGREGEEDGREGGGEHDG